ncbi:hypothetical protein RUND412_004951 [Rhizina undulata]
MLGISAPSKLRLILVTSALGLLFIYTLSDRLQGITESTRLEAPHLTSSQPGRAHGPTTTYRASYSPSLTPANPPDTHRHDPAWDNYDDQWLVISPPSQHLGDDEPEVGEEEDLEHGVSVFPPDNLTKHLVIPRLDTEDIGWVYSLPPELNITIMPYLVNPNDDSPPDMLKTPENKGHEAMAYLTYLIDNYSDLPDIVLFIHPHQVAWHNNDLLLSSTQLILRELNYRRVKEKGYMNLRCHHKPGCPTWIRPGNRVQDPTKVEESVFAQSFTEMFGGGFKDVPKVFGAPCCAQFAVTRDTIQGVNIGTFIKLRQWLLDTPLDDKTSGRIFEYMWQYVFTSQPIFCPSEHVCFCDGYGYCFTSDYELKQWFEKRDRVMEKEKQLEMARDDEGVVEGKDAEIRRLGMEGLEREIAGIREELERELKKARRRGRQVKGRKEVLGDEFSG